MPENTFKNLHPAKRKKFISAALREFALNDYKNASVTGLVRELGIAKGSVYQYFKNKKDLYKYLIEYAGRIKMNYVNAVADKSKDDFIEWFINFHKAGAEFDLKNPLYSTFLYNVSQERNSIETGDLLKEGKQRRIEYYKSILSIYQLNGTLRRDLDLELAAFMIVQLSSGIFEYISMKFEVDFRAHLEDKEGIPDVDMDKLEDHLRNMAMLIKEGISPK